MASTPYRSDTFSLNLSGSYKNLFFASKEQATGGRYLADLNRIRLEGEGRFFEKLQAKISWDNELIGGDYISTAEFAAREAARNESYPDMEYEIHRSGRFFYGQRLHRASLQYDASPLTVTLGRQRIDWGVMRINPVTDLFVRPPIFDVEKDEFIAPVAANLGWVPAEGWKVNPVYTLEGDFDRSRTGIRVTKTIGRFDASLLGGRFLRDTLVGFDFTGDYHDMGLRGEFFHDWAVEGGDFVQSAIGIDYGFPNSLYLAIEYFFNGQGTGDRATALPFPNTGPFLKSVYEHFVGLELKYDLTPLWNLLLLSQNDLQGGSVLVNAETTYSLFSWMELLGGAVLPVGSQTGEFGPVSNLYYTHIKLFF